MRPLLLSIFAADADDPCDKADALHIGGKLIVNPYTAPSIEISAAWPLTDASSQTLSDQFLNLKNLGLTLFDAGI